MSDWEDFCESNGWNAGSPDDYDKFLDSLEDRPQKNSPRNQVDLQFGTFDEAKAWAKSNVGRSFARNPHGQGFVPVHKKENKR